MKLCIIGSEGNFGSFLKSALSEYNDIAGYSKETADTFILAVPLSEYKNAAQQIVNIHGNKIHFVNVCSVQEDTTDLLLRMIDKNCGSLTSIHPLFGPRSSKSRSDRVSVVTYAHGKDSDYMIKLFSMISVIRGGVTPKQHDEFMAKTHYQVVRIADQINKIVENAKDVPDYMLTPSFKKMKELANQFLDMPEGTRSSILANKYGLEKLGD